MLSFQDLVHGLFVIGETGVGKSHALAGLALRGSAQGAVVVVEPHRQLVSEILARLPAARLRDVYVIDLDAEWPVGLNLVERPEPPTVENMSASATLASHAFSKLFELDRGSAPRLMQTLHALIYTLMENEATLVESVPLLTSAEVREKMVANLSNPEILAFWQEYNGLSAREKREQTDSTRNKLSAFLALPMVRNMVGQVESLQVGELMDSGKILLVTLSPRFEEASALIAEIVLTKCLLSAFARADSPEEKRLPCLLILDEFQRWASDTTAIFLREARKFRIATCLGTQTLAGLSEENRAAALACGNLMVFRVSGLDSPILAKSFDASPQQVEREIIGSEPVRAPCSDVLGHMERSGHSNAVIAQWVNDWAIPLERV